MDDIVKAALAKWPGVPHCYGWLGLDRRGRWYMRDDRTQAAGPFPASKGSLLTHDKDRYADEIWWQTQKPEIVTGPPSWRWVIEGFRSMRELAADPRLKTMDVPTLMLVAKHDGLIDAQAALKIAPKLPDLRLVTFGKESAHEILREVDPVRNRALGEIDLFLAARAPKH